MGLFKRKDAATAVADPSPVQDSPDELEAEIARLTEANRAAAKIPPRAANVEQSVKTDR